MKGIKKALFIMLLACLLAVPHKTALAVSDNEGTSSKEKVSDEEKADAKNLLYRYYDNLMLLHDDLDKEDEKKLQEIMNNGKKLINEAEDAGDLSSYVSEIKSLMEAYIDKVISEIPTSTSEFLVVGDNAATATAVHGQQVNLVLPIYNMGSEWIDDITVTPVMSNSVKEWPFEIEKTGYSARITELPGSADKDEAYLNHREVHYTFTTREDVLSGYYKLEFDILFRRNNKSETAKLYTFVKTEGAPGSGSMDGETDDASKSSTPRIVITGFETNPAEVYAGDTFMLTIHVRNTSKRTAVSNVEFNLEAAQEGKDENTLYAAFLPTSGSNTVYVDTIPVGGGTELNIEMTAKADLVQKPYALNVKMDYEDEKYNPYTNTSSVSIPVRQESKFDMSTPEVTPASVTVGDQANIMFSIYNTGKTTLYNVQARFEGEGISGGEAFVGKIEAGGTGNVDTMVNADAPTTGDGIVRAIISYEDDAGNVTESEKEIELFVTEELPPDMGMEGIVDGDMAQTQGPNKTVIAALIAGGCIAAAVIVIIVILKIRKKRRKAKELAEDLLDLDEEDGNGKETK